MLQTGSPDVESPSEQLDRVWKELKSRNLATVEHDGGDSGETTGDEQQHRSWPTYDTVMGDMTSADYNHTLTCPHDVLGRKAEGDPMSKTLSPHGAVCQVKIHLFPGHSYTGLLAANTTIDHAIMRLSTAMKPPKEEIKSTWARALLYATGDKLRNAKLFPCAAIKVFRTGVRSGNLLFGGSKIGQREPDFFAHCMCTSMTEQMPRTVRPFVGKFWQYSDYPLSLGISDFTAFDQDGRGHTENHFPFALVLKPRQEDIPQRSQLSREGACSPLQNGVEQDSFDAFLEHALAVPEGTPIFDIFAVETPGDVPDASKLQRIGMVTTASSMITSGPSDGLFFRHQRKEEDYKLRPSWKNELKRTVELDNGRTTGTIGRLTGWKLFEQHIDLGLYRDYEAT